MPVIANMTLKTTIGIITGIVNPFQVWKKGWMVLSTSGKLFTILIEPFILWRKYAENNTGYRYW